MFKNIEKIYNTYYSDTDEIPLRFEDIQRVFDTQINLRFFDSGMVSDNPSGIIPQLTKTDKNIDLINETYFCQTTETPSGKIVDMFEYLHAQNGNNTLWGLLNFIDEADTTSEAYQEALGWMEREYIKIIRKS